MNLQHLSIVALVAVGAGGATLAVARGSPQYLAAGGVMIAAGLAAQAAAMSATARALRRFKNWCSDTSPEVAVPPRLPAPLDAFGVASSRRLEVLGEQLAASQSEARRARVAARSLQQEHGVLRALLESLSDGVVMVDATGAPTFANPAARRFLDLSADADLGRDARDLATVPALRTVFVDGVKGEAHGSRKTRDVDCSDQAQRRVLRVAFQNVAAADGSGGDSSLAILLTDVTREVELNRMKSNFASSVSHELKTPLASMRAFLEMLIDGDIDGEEERREHMQLVLDETERLTRLVQNLLNLSRLEAGITKMDRDAISLAELLEHLREVVTPLAASRGQTMVFEISEYLPTVTGDRNLLEQAIMNLVSNAIKYTPEGGSIRVRAGLAGREAELAVIDTGVGIPEKALNLVFDKFTRVENSAGLKATGTGLGLPLARFVAEAHGGSVSVTSVVGKGSEFRMLLPVRRAEESSECQLVGLEGISG